MKHVSLQKKTSLWCQFPDILEIAKEYRDSENSSELLQGISEVEGE